MTTTPVIPPIESPSFRAPNSDKWRPLPPTDPSDEEVAKHARANRSELSSMLLGSMQMPHVVVLAGSGTSIAVGGPSMADLWKNAVGTPPKPSAISTAEKVTHDLSNTNIEVLLSRIESYLQIRDDEEVRAFLRQSKKVILEACSGFLDQCDLSAHRTFLHRLARRRTRDQRLKIFTTNYDLCFEQAAASLGFVVIDGFAFSSPRQYDPRFFAYDIVRRSFGAEDSSQYLEGVFLLYKLHGSVQWARSADGTILETLSPDPDEACLIYPASGKYQQSYTQPYLESIAQYLAALREPNTCVVVTGFGFNDDHLAEPILAAVRSNPHLRLIVADPGAKRNAESGSKYWEELIALSERGEDVWILGVGFSDLGELIPDLKSLSPAEALMKALRGVTG